MNVNILQSFRNPALVDMSTLVFKTLKVGFPKAESVVYDNTHNEWTHAEWISELILQNDNPFWVSDTDIVFLQEMESITSLASLKGRYIPTFREPWTNTIKVEGIHTCLMFINPVKLRIEFEQWIKRFDTEILERFGFEFSLIGFIRGKIISTPTTPLLYDCMSQLWNIVSCEPFTDEENSRFEHVYAGTYSDRLTHMPHLQDIHKSAAENPLSVRGLQQQQNKFYKERSYA